MRVPHILVVDDDAPARETVVNLLGEINCTTQEARDGMEALQWLHVETFDLVVTDNNMPRMTGIELLERMRNEERFQNTPVILQSGGGTSELKRRVQELDGLFLEKPSGKLLELVETLLVL